MGSQGSEPGKFVAEAPGPSAQGRLQLCYRQHSGLEAKKRWLGEDCVGSQRRVEFRGEVGEIRLPKSDLRLSSPRSRAVFGDINYSDLALLVKALRDFIRANIWCQAFQIDAHLDP